MKFLAKLFVFASGLMLSAHAMAGLTVGGQGLGVRKLDLKYTSMMLDQLELKQFTMLPDSAKDIGRESGTPQGLKFVPDEEFVELQNATYIQVTDDNGQVVRTFAVSKLDETTGTLVFVECVHSVDYQ